MWIDNPDSPNLMPDNFANAGPELRAYMRGASPHDIREDSYHNTRDILRSKIDSQEAFSRIAGREIFELPKPELTEPVPWLKKTEPYQWPNPELTSIERFTTDYDLMQASMERKRKSEYDEFMDKHGIYPDSYMP